MLTYKIDLCENCRILDESIGVVALLGRQQTIRRDDVGAIYNAHRLSLSTSSLPASMERALAEREMAVPFWLGETLPQADLREIQRKLSLHHCKWDCQVGDVPTLFPQALLIDANEWERLKRLAQGLGSELEQAEQELFERTELHELLGAPVALRSVLKDARRHGTPPSAVRVMRFDFHYTDRGWQISEVNSDVPGGYIEASAFTEMVAKCVPQAIPTGNPGQVWTEKMAHLVGESGRVALLSAVGFLEDQQQTAFLAMQLEQQGIETVLLHHAKQLIWETGRAITIARGKRVKVDAIVRFYQGEWLASARNNAGWQWLFSRGKTPVTNASNAVLTESKRFPLTWEFLSSGMSTWRTLLPECCDPREQRWRNGGEWVLKMAYSNTGDQVHLRERMSSESWSMVCRAAQRNPEDWIVQRRFQCCAIESDAGPVYPCIGVYVINGVVAGAYARVSKRQVIDYAAMDAALLVGKQQC